MVSTVNAEHEGSPFDSSSDLLFRVCSLCGCTVFLLILLFFYFHGAKKYARRKNAFL